MRATTGTLGLRLQQQLAGGGFVHGTLGWRQASGDRGTAQLSFAGSQPFTINGTAASRDGAVVQLGAQFNLSRNTTLGLGYAAQFGSGGRDHGGRVMFGWRL